MHILATFATLCCQTRWPRNHSCTTQEHVSFFRTFSGHFRKFRLFRHFDKKRSNLQILWKMLKNKISHVRTFSKTFSQTRTSPKTFRACSQVSANVQMCKCANVQMCKKPSCTKCANLQRKLFSKCRNHKSALCTKTQMQISAHVKFRRVQYFFSLCANFFYAYIFFFTTNFKFVNSFHHSIKLLYFN